MLREKRTREGGEAVWGRLVERTALKQRPGAVQEGALRMPGGRRRKSKHGQVCSGPARRPVGPKGVSQRGWRVWGTGGRALSAFERRCWDSGFLCTRGEKPSEGFEPRRRVLLTSKTHALAVELQIFSQAEAEGSCRNKWGRKAEVAWAAVVVGDVVTSCQVLLAC